VEINQLAMDTPFVYDRYVTGRNFVGRKMDCTILSNLLEAGENVVMYEPPKSGKMSVIQQTLYNRRASGKQFMVVHVNMFNIRTIEDFLIKYGAAVIRPLYSTQYEYASVVAKYLEGTHFVFDPSRFASCGEVVSVNWTLDANDMEQMIRLPAKIARERGVPYYVILEEFQMIMMDKDYEDLLKVMETVLSERNPQVSYIFAGSQVNAMKYIFAERKFFHRMVEYLQLQPVDDREIIEHIVRGFMQTGKVIERELVLGACKLFRGQMWYLNHFTSICDTMTRGYLNEGILMEALKVIISIHEPRFNSIVNDLTDHQLSLLKAVLDGVVKFSSSEVIERYRLNSSANVRRVKDALKKKEVITFNEKDEPVILDPLFEYWVRKHYFEME
jgi:KaiC/GvpD/RAD55 family RecA-like ATPase